MQRKTIVSISALCAIFAASSAWAADGAGSNTTTAPGAAQDQSLQNQSAAYDPNSPGDRDARATGADQRKNRIERNGTSGLNDAQKKQAQEKLAPHVLRMQSSLEAAIDQVKGMRDQLRLTQDKNLPISNEVIAHLRDYDKDLSGELKKAQSHEALLRSGAKSFPELAKSDDLRSIDSALSDASREQSSLRSKISSSQYWKDRNQARNDIDNLEKRLNTALDKTKSFGSDKLDVVSG